MNFLSHYYLHQEPDDPFFTIGLTLPDILGIFIKDVKVSERTLKKLDYHQYDEKTKSLAAGMILHFNIDRWFHTHHFFKEGLKFLQKEFLQKSGKNYSEFHSHILLEILIDRFLLDRDSQLADQFYKNYQSFDFKQIIPFFESFSTFDRKDFLHYTSFFSQSTFLNEYKDFKNIQGCLDRISMRVNYFNADSMSPDEMERFFKNSYHQLEEKIDALFKEAQELPYSKSAILESL